MISTKILCLICHFYCVNLFKDDAKAVDVIFSGTLAKIKAVAQISTEHYILSIHIKITPYKTALPQHGFTLTRFETWAKPLYNMTS